MKIEELFSNPSINDLDLITEEHYNKQMSTVKTILNYDKKGLTVREIGMKLQLADTYIEMVILEGEEKMNKYWKEIYGMKEKI